MGRKRIKVQAEPEAPEATPVEPVEPEAAPKGGEVRILDQADKVVRVYSRTLHGDNYENLAGQFVAKFAERGYRQG